MSQTDMQIGKNGVTSNFLETLKNAFKNHHIVKISVLKNAGHTRENVKEINAKILGEMGSNYNSKIIGFKIILRKWKKKG